MTDLKSARIQIRVIAVIEKDIAVASLEDALTIGRELNWLDIFPSEKTTIADGKFEIVGVFADWNLEV